jgi:hypothetical protein
MLLGTDYENGVPWEAFEILKSKLKHVVGNSHDGFNLAYPLEKHINFLN